MKGLLSSLMLACLLVGLPARSLADIAHDFGPGELDLSPQQPRVAIAPDGSIYLVYGSENSIFCSTSHDGGRTFSKPSAIPEAGILSLGMHRGPRVAATGEYVVVSAIVGKEGRGRDGNLVAWRSANRGTSWSQPVIINDVTDSAREGLHSLAAGRGNIVLVVWLDLRGPGTELYGAVSENGGLTWGRNTLIYRSPDGTICQCCHPSVAVDEAGVIHVMWRNARNGARDMYLSSSSDRGMSFSPARKLGEGTWILEACPMDGGDVAASAGRGVQTVWRREDKIFLASPNEQEKFVGYGKNPALAYGANGKYVAWQDSTEKSLVLLRPDHRGPFRLSSSGSFITLVGGARGEVVAAWEESDQGRKKVKVRILK